jgi:hypothetical protein
MLIPALYVVAYLGPEWLRTVPDWLVLPVTQVVGDSLNWFARDASIGELAVKDITRLFGQFIDRLIQAAVVILADGLFSG